jgi:hypothetical protein
MSISVVQILTVGPATVDTLATLRRLVCSGWSSHSVSTVREAETVLKTIRFNVVLSAEKLADGMGYDLAPILTRQQGTLYIGVALSETCLWLPVVERGLQSVGDRAMNSAILETEVARLLRRMQYGIAAAEGAIREEPKAKLLIEAAGVRALAEESPLDFGAEPSTLGQSGTVTGKIPAQHRGGPLRATPKTLLPPPRRQLPGRGAEPDMTRLLARCRDDTKPIAGTHRNGWRE